MNLMEYLLWLIPLLLSSCLISYLLPLFLSKPPPHHHPKKTLPPSPPSIPFLFPLAWLRARRLSDVEPILRRLHSLHGPILTVRILSKPSIFISDPSLAHVALVTNGALFADRLPSNALNRVIACDRHNVSSAPYGPLWRSLRRNLASQILHPSRGLTQFAGARGRVLRELLTTITAKQQGGGGGGGVVVVKDDLKLAMFSILVIMCFGEEEIEPAQIREIEDVQKALLGSFTKFNIFTVFPTITKVLFRARWKLLLDIRRRQEESYMPLIIKARQRQQQRQGQQQLDVDVVSSSYLDSLLELSIPAADDDGGSRKLTDGEIVSLCSEFLGAGTDTTATALEWIMAELVKNQDIQRRLFEEIDQLTSTKNKKTQSTYLKAVILEGLRRHPPAHFVVPHVVTEDVEIGGYMVPANATVNFMVADIGWDGKVWSSPMEFMPERFLEGGEGEGVDVTGTRKIKMMPFGAGRRICPGLGLAMLHLEYFAENLVRVFEWKAVEGEEVDLTETMELGTVMKNPLRATVVARRPEMK